MKTSSFAGTVEVGINYIISEGCEYGQLFVGGLEEKNFTINHDKMLIACSGGPDSMALLQIFINTFYNDTFAAAYISHDIRPEEEVEKELRIVRYFCEKNNVQFFTESITPKELDGNYESNARKMRYEALAKIADDNRYKFIFTAHHADDQLETMLMRLCRGCSIGGLVGIERIRRIYGHKALLARPMLGVTKKEAESFCSENSVPYFSDLTNLDKKYARNKLRWEVLPVLKNMFPKCSVNSFNLSEDFICANQLVDEIASKISFVITHQYTNYEGKDKAYSIRIKRDEIKRVTSNPLVVGYFLRNIFSILTENKHMDKLSRKLVQESMQELLSDRSICYEFKCQWPGEVSVYIQEDYIELQLPSRNKNNIKQI